ncbi:MAG: membrane protein insertion efficiency factor YidD [Leptospiraceae bacterium]|nr:membrane protein insertion efficiency factor YidD [Leptospiraceae bacterium]MCP5498526.1 membrane protein insertion efficiency factor YidD [Leptospiraceae bacterium]
MNRVAIFIIGLYKKFLSPLLPGACRFYPSCSEYATQAFQNFNFFYAFYLSIKRIARCNPLSEGYHDPIPENPKKKG